MISDSIRNKWVSATQLQMALDVTNGNTYQPFVGPRERSEADLLATYSPSMQAVAKAANKAVTHFEIGSDEELMRRQSEVCAYLRVIPNRVTYDSFTQRVRRRLADVLESGFERLPPLHYDMYKR